MSIAQLIRGTLVLVFSLALVGPGVVLAEPSGDPQDVVAEGGEVEPEARLFTLSEAGLFVQSTILNPNSFDVIKDIQAATGAQDIQAGN
jgi:hypothetical protein